MSGPVVLPESSLERYRRFSLYNSPYTAHDEGRAVDLYPEPGTAPSPVSGEVVDVRSVSAPPKSYAEAEDHLILVAVDGGVRRGRSGADGTGADPVARILHVDPAVEPGDRVEAGEDLGRTIRSGFFAPWVGDHLHVGFRAPDANPYRASGSLPVEADVAVEPVSWDGRGTVVERGDTYVVLDSPAHPDPDRGWAGIAADGGGVLDGGFPHYDGGGLLRERGAVEGTGSPGTPREGGAGDDAGAPNAGGDGPTAGDGPPDGEPVDLLGTRIGTARGRTVAWADRTVLANGRAITGLSLYVGRDRAGAKLVCPDAEFPEGSGVRVRIE